MKRLYVFAIFGVGCASLLAAVIAFSPRAARSQEVSQGEPEVALSEAGESTMPDQSSSTNIDSKLVAANTAFAFKLYSAIGRESGSKNVFISPASIAMALAMTYNGSEAETRAAMSKALEFDSMSLDEVNRSFSALRTALTSPDPKVKLAIANSLWGKNGVRFKPDFIQRNKEFFGSEVTTLDFGDPASPSKINGWVKDKTNGKIDQIVDRIDPMSVLFLINAIYFKGSWTDEFKKSETRDEAFRTAGGDQPRVPMMHQSGTYRYLETAGFQAVSLPYGSGRTSLYIFLPGGESDLATFQSKLTAQNWNQWMSKFGRNPGQIAVPRFKVEYEITLNDALKALGMDIAFDADRANFRGMAESQENISISRVKHKTFCEVNEEGTEAAAVTSVEMRATSAMRPQEPFKMIVDRPFFYAIRDNQSGEILFMGSIGDPR